MDTSFSLSPPKKKQSVSHEFQEFEKSDMQLSTTKRVLGELLECCTLLVVT
jgi:hypothetical protein